MNFNNKKNRSVTVMLATLLFSSATLYSQDEDAIIVDGVPLENSIVGRDMAVRLRGEIQTSDSADDLIDENIAYKRFPKEIYTSEIKFYFENRSDLSIRHSSFNNDQGLDLGRWYGNLGIPLNGNWKANLKYKHNALDDADDREYGYLGVGGYIGMLYTYSQYRYKMEGGEENGHQISEYLSWRPGNGLRMGIQGAIEHAADIDDYPWYVRIFSTIFLIEERTSLRSEALYHSFLTP